MAFNALSNSMSGNESFHLNSALGHLINDYDYLFYVSPVGVKMEDNGVRETDLRYRDNINKKNIRNIRLERSKIYNNSRYN